MKCLTRLFFLKRDIEGCMYLISINSQKIKSKARENLTVGCCTDTSQEEEIEIKIEDEIIFHQCKIFFHGESCLQAKYLCRKIPPPSLYTT